MATGHRAKVGEFENQIVSYFRAHLFKSFIRLQQNTGDTSADCRIFEPKLRILPKLPKLPILEPKLQDFRGFSSQRIAGFSTRQRNCEIYGSLAFMRWPVATWWVFATKRILRVNCKKYSKQRSQRLGASH